MTIRGYLPIGCALAATALGVSPHVSAQEARTGAVDQVGAESTAPARQSLPSLVEPWGPAASAAAGASTWGGPMSTAAVPRPLPFFYDLYTFRTPRGGTTVVASVAVPVRRLRAERRDGRYQYRFDVRFVLADTTRRSVVPTLDSVFVSRRRPLPRQHLLHTHIQVEAPPSRSTVQRVVVTDATRPGVGQLYTTPFTIPDYRGSRLMLSDVAFGLPGATSGWTRGDVTLALLPTSLFPESSFDVYYEIYNLPAGSRYETEISIEPVDDDDEDRVVRTRFSSISSARPDGTMVERRRVDSALPKGRYRFTVTVRNEGDGSTASKSRFVEVRGWERGTTLVPALPRGRRVTATQENEPPR